ncbi:hypothetical protein K7472_14470 [Streptomyces sp. PTM05]|uniref:NAD(+)--protein-arginine ADP-ribosyltransferase n=1 Tax=Streptantibioticus parmotrematis TaxID=2873249 RepID=A0ABS7QT01_9ACTN|nr:hypothetical protein [Streptantibioticus parmotrematis]
MHRPAHERPPARGEFTDRLSARLARAALRGTGPALESRSIGNALLVHPRGFVDSRALTFAERLAADPQHTLVVLDLPASPQDAVRETLAKALDRRGRSFRLVPGRGDRGDVSRTAQWLADRLERMVLAPDGAVLPAAGGALFVPAHHGAGWLRYRPHVPTVPDARRFPTPHWEFSVPDRPRTTPGGGTLEPLPGGVWLRGEGDEASAAGHRGRLVDLLAGHPRLLAVVLGGPCESMLPLEEVAAFWRQLPGSARPLVRFVPYGPVAVPEGASLGQALADLLGQRVAVHPGLPVAGPHGEGTRIRTLPHDGGPGWQPYAEEFGFAPRAQTGGRPAAPVPLSVRPPVGDLAPLGPGVYRYASDAVLEIVQSGLWMRPPADPRDGHTVRAAPADPPSPVVLYDETDPAVTDRMRALAHELLRRLAPSFARDARVVPSGEAGRPLVDAIVRTAPGSPAARPAPLPTGSGTADGWLADGPAAGGRSPAPAPGEHGTWTDAPAAPPPTTSGPARPREPEPREPEGPQQPPHNAPLAAQPPVPDIAAPPKATPVPGPDLPAAPADDPATARAHNGPAAVPPPPQDRPPHEPPTPAAPPRPPTAPRIRLEASSPGPAAPAPGPTPRPPGRDGTGAADRPVSTTRADASPSPHLDRAPRAQPEPSRAADIAPSDQGLERERDWLRRGLGERYDTATGFVSRVLSEAPGLRGGAHHPGPDALTDLAAVHLYLAGATSAIDTAIRTGTPGPHVPLARCAANGLRRLPSHRGATLLRATLGARERAWYAEAADAGTPVVERSFLSAATTVRRGLPGTTDVLVWSLTARRTALVAPDIPDRVLFAPGTRFKVLRVTDGDRPAVLLREIHGSEAENGRPGGDPAAVDDIATTGLDRVHALWREIEQDPGRQAGEPLPDEHADVFRAAPGLLQDEPGGPHGPVRPAAPPQKGATS